MDLRLLQQKLPEVIAWVEQTLAAYRNTARPVASLGFKRLPAYYPTELLATATFIPVACCPVPPLSKMGLAGFDEFENLPAAGITYLSSFFVLQSHMRDESLHFHELVHVVQWQHLGTERFIMAYALGHLLSGGYRSNPLEEMAYGLQERFDRGEAGFDVVQVARRECDRVVPALLTGRVPAT